MGKEKRFETVIEEGTSLTGSGKKYIIRDNETGVNYLLGSHEKQMGTGLTVLVGPDGKPIVTPCQTGT